MTAARPYYFNADLKIWVTPTHDGTSYSDGDAVEHRLLSALQHCQNVSASSEELRTHIIDWPSEYHLSPTRHNLLRPFTFGPSDRILEIGCGCGAITRYLGECGATVVAVEGSRRRAMIAAERCRDLPNVSVYCDNLIDFQFDSTFNYITLIGVLEYSNQFITASDPVHACLEKVGHFLTKDGALILAIENQLGLKYFNGCKEDHLGIPYFGINSLYSANDPITFGRHVLMEELIRSDFPVHEFFYPFPDYKLPGLILSEAALSDVRLNVADLLIHNTGRDYPETHYRAFAEDLAWRAVVENHLVADLANSFLIFARRTGARPTSTNWLAKMFSRGHRHHHYQVNLTIDASAGNSLKVRKHKPSPDPHCVDEWFHHIVSDSDYIPGKLLIGKIHKLMALETKIDELASCFKPWLVFLFANATKNKQGELVLPGNFIDCIPGNMLEGPAGDLHYFDAEWESRDPVPMVWTVIRGIVDSLTGCLENSALKSMTYRQFISAVTKSLNLDLSESDFMIAENWETKLISQCYVNSTTTPIFSPLYDKPLFLVPRLSGHVPQLRQRLAWHDVELSRIKRTLSWRITAPLRATWNTLKTLF